MSVFRYKFILLYIDIILIVRVVVGHNSDLDSLDKENEKFEASERRVMEAYRDINWHVAHLKETDFEEEEHLETRRVESGCLPETFAEKLKRYRRTLKNDAALIEFVSAHAIPVDESELIRPQCKIANETHGKNGTHHDRSASITSIALKSSTEIAAIYPIMKYTEGNVQLEDLENKSVSVSPFRVKHRDEVAFRASLLKLKSKTKTNHTEVKNFTKDSHSLNKDSLNQTLLNTTNVSPAMGINTTQSVDAQNETQSNVTAAKKEPPTVSTKKKVKKSATMASNGPEVMHQATTPKLKAKKVKKHESRRGEYVFSSHEYYDDVIDFDVSVCPDDVEETILELDIIRPYDVECELALEWSSLE